jgi:hypothetical protein
VDFDFVVAIGGLLEVGVGAFGDDVAGGLGEVDIGALRGAFGDEIAGVLGDRLVDSSVSVLCVPFLQVDLDFEIVLESVLNGMLGTVI